MMHNAFLEEAVSLDSVDCRILSPSHTALCQSCQLALEESASRLQEAFLIATMHNLCCVCKLFNYD